jgi:hypothetical protein
MFSSRNIKGDIILALYQDIRTVFRLNDIAMLVGETDSISLNKKMNYLVRTGKILNPRKGIYAKANYNPQELACSVYTPSYISFEYVLQRAGIVFQYDSRITVVSYLSREIEVGDQTYWYRKIKGEMLVNTAGIIRQNNHINIASQERAFLDAVYLNADYYFDNLNPLNKQLIYKILPFYQSKSLTIRVTNLLQNGKYKSA